MRTRSFNIIIEGVDNIGKSTLVNGLAKRFCQSQPKLLHCIGMPNNGEAERTSKLFYASLFRLLSDNHHTFIVDRGHLGEAVYSPIYRNYSGDYIFALEVLLYQKPTLLILLDTHNPAVMASREDGLSLSGGKVERIAEEARLFRVAYAKSELTKTVILVDDHAGPTGVLNAVLLWLSSMGIESRD